MKDRKFNEIIEKSFATRGSNAKDRTGLSSSQRFPFLIMLFNYRDFKLDRFYPSSEITIRVIDGG